MNRTRRRSTIRRQRAERRGRLAEWLCLWHLRLRGWHIVARGWRCPAGEIDIVARRGKVLAIIEVKSRAEVTVAANALTPRQRRRISRAAEALIASRPDLGRLDIRFDLMLVAPQRLPRHWRDAWRPDR
jgi:putative endonuclease